MKTKSDLLHLKDGKYKLSKSGKNNKEGTEGKEGKEGKENKKRLKPFSQKTWTGSMFITFLIFGLLLTVQYRTQIATENALTNQKQEDLVAILKNLDSNKAKLETELESLQNTKRSLENKAQAGLSLNNGLQKQIRQLQIANGSIDVAGPGITITIIGDSVIMNYDLIDIVNELWLSGAEAVAINDIRILDTTTIEQIEDKNGNIVITINGQVLLSPIEITAIGDGVTLEKGLTFPGGIIDNMNTLYQIYPQIEISDSIFIPMSTNIKINQFVK